MFLCLRDADTTRRCRVKARRRVCACVRYLGGQQRVGVKALHAADQLVLRVHHIVHEAAVDQEPVGASVHRDALWDLAVAEAPHVRVTLVEETVQALLSDEAEETHDVRWRVAAVCPLINYKLELIPSVIIHDIITQSHQSHTQQHNRKIKTQSLQNFSFHAKLDVVSELLWTGREFVCYFRKIILFFHAYGDERMT